MYIYQADCWCDSCGEYIREDLDAKGKRPPKRMDETTYDSDHYPKRASDDEESDTPMHCASGETCLEAEELADEHSTGVFKIGKLLSTNLTNNGVEYVKEAIREGGEVAQFWKEAFSRAGYDLETGDEDDSD